MGRAPSAAGGIVAARMRRWFGAHEGERSAGDAEQDRRVTDKALLRDIWCLDDRQLAEIGICRRPRYTKWPLPWIGRGITRVSILEFDYFFISRRE